MKSVLVIETPIDCEDCPLYDADLMRCHYLKNEAYGVDALPKWCPLKPLPEHKHETEAEVFAGGIKGIYRSSYYEGWNACVDELLGEDK